MKIGEWLLGRKRDPLKPQTYHHLALAAFLAWVGLGADGLSSSCYGPEEAFLALGAYHDLAIFLALATAVTVLILSASYSLIIERFPTGGGGYVVSTKLLGPGAGLVSGSALLVDYVLTIAISVASGIDALFNFLPLEYHGYKMMAGFGVMIALLFLNLRGVKESVTVLVPIFLAFVVTHVVAIVWALVGWGGEFPHIAQRVSTEFQTGTATLGLWGVAVLLLKAYSLGGGTFTGIEAVSNGIQILKEPRVQTGKRAMIYMSVSLAFTAGGILLAYLLVGVQPETGKTLNAVLIHRLFENWPGGEWLIWVTLVSEGVLLFVAAQAGFVDGPRVLASMAIDSWVPRSLANLSDRMVVQNGVLFMGGAAAVLYALTGGSVRILVVMYSINVFLTFTLSQLAMCRHWLRSRARAWGWKFLLNGTGFAMTFTILCTVATLKFHEGGWVTLVITAAFVAACIAINFHYRGVSRMLSRLNQLTRSLALEKARVPERPFDTGAPTAVLLVSGYGGLGIHSFFSVLKTFPGYFQNFVFVSVGVVDYGKFKGIEEAERLQETTGQAVDQYVEQARKLGFHAEGRFAVSTDPIDAIEDLCTRIARDFPRAVFFGGQLIFPNQNLLTRLLHAQSIFEIQRRLQYRGLNLMILPIRVVV